VERLPGVLAALSLTDAQIFSRSDLSNATARFGAPVTNACTPHGRKSDIWNRHVQAKMSPKAWR
jgi:hypothetical protein